MSKHHIYFYITLLFIPTIHAEGAIKSGVKKWFKTAFGIDANEQFTNQPFSPTVENLHTILLRPCAEPEADKVTSVSELAHAIDQDKLSKIAYLTLTNSDETVATHWQVEKGLTSLEENEPVFVYSRGYAGAERPARKRDKERGLCAIPKRGGGLIVGSQWLKGGCINGTCVMFDYPDTRNYFDFGTHNDQKCLITIHEALAQKTNNVIFFGNCRGSKSLLTYLCRSRPQHVSAVVLDAPFLDLDRFVKEIGRNYGRLVPFSHKVAKKIITSWYPNCLQSQDLNINELINIPVHIPIFIGHLKGDSLVADQMIQDMVKILRDSGHIVYLLVIDDKTKSHSRLYQTKPFQKAMNAFLKQYNLPHNPQLAQEGKALLSRAYYTVQHVDIWKRGFLHVIKA